MTLRVLASCALASIVALTGCIVDNSSPPEGEGGASQGGGGQDGSGGSTGGSGGAGRTCYEPTSDQGMDSGTWADAQGETTRTITVPDDPGGGILRVRVTTDDSDSIPSVSITHTSFPGGGAILAESSATTADEQTWNGALITAGGESYELFMTQFFAAQGPVTWTLDWTFEPLFDCYEPNDSPETASPIALGEEVEAYAVSTHGDDGTSTDWRRGFDHYALEVTEARTLTFDLQSLPSTIAMRVRLLRRDPDSPDSLAQVQGTESLEATGTLAYEVDRAGTYIFELVPEGQDVDGKQAQEDPDPAHWSETYRFRVD